MLNGYLQNNLARIVKNADMPTVWAKFFADVITEVEKRFNGCDYDIELDAKPGGGRKCIFVFILPSCEYSRMSSNNLNVTGWDWYRVEKLEEGNLNVEVGYNNWWYAPGLFAELLNHKIYIDALEKLCTTRSWYHKRRVNKGNYKTIEGYSSLTEYFKRVTPNSYRESTAGFKVTSKDVKSEIRQGYWWLDHLSIAIDGTFKCEPLLAYLKKHGNDEIESLLSAPDSVNSLPADVADIIKKIMEQLELSVKIMLLLDLFLRARDNNFVQRLETLLRKYIDGKISINDVLRA